MVAPRCTWLKQAEIIMGGNTNTSKNTFSWNNPIGILAVETSLFRLTPVFRSDSCFRFSILLFCWRPLFRSSPALFVQLPSLSLKTPLFCDGLLAFIRIPALMSLMLFCWRPLFRESPVLFFQLPSPSLKTSLFSASRLLGFAASRLLGFSASRLRGASQLLRGFSASRLLGFAALLGFSASRLLGAAPLVSAPFTPALFSLDDGKVR